MRNKEERAMQGARVKLYLLVSGLFDQPEEACSDFHFSLVAKLLHDAPPQWGFRVALARLERDLVEDAHAGAQLDAEYARLFGAGEVPALAPPRATHWLGDESVERVGRLMSACYGVESCPDPGHLICELEFMAYLVADDTATRDIQAEFLANHLARWIPPFVRAVRKTGALPRFRLAADLLERLIRSETLLLGAPGASRESLRVA
jgi:TorA maturation chaperone TorD